MVSTCFNSFTFKLRVTCDCILVQAFVTKLRGRSITDFLNDFVPKKKKQSEHSKNLTEIVLQLPLSLTWFPVRKGHA